MSPKAIPLRERFEPRVAVTATCWEWLGYITEQGYGRIAINRKNVRAHRVSWELYVGPIPAGMNVLHRCDNRRCVRPSHLFLGTQADNIHDMVAKHRHIAGDTHPRRKLSEESVRQIRKLHAEGARTRDLAARYGVSDGHISHIIKGRVWAEGPKANKGELAA